MNQTVTHQTNTRIPRTTAASHPAPVRLTRRGRVVVLLALLSLLLVAFSLGRAAHSNAAARTPGTTSAPVAYTQTTVHPGETLWAVARRVAPGHDPRALVQQIRELNHLDGGGVQAGQQLVLPKAA